MQQKNGWLEVLESVALFLLKMGTFVAKNWKEISVDATNVLLCYDLFRKERDKYKVSLMNRSYLISQKRSP